MQTSDVSISSTNILLEAAPIQRDWVLQGSPEARNRVIFKSRDGNAWTMVWECTAGIFNWHYDCDETVHILDGHVLLTMGSETRELGPGDAVFFPAGSQVTWQVDTYVRKIAFLRQNVPPALGLIIKLIRRARTIATKVTRGTTVSATGRFHHSAQS